MPAIVYFADASARSPKRNSVSKLAALLEAAGLAGIVAKDDLVAIKVHFGELGNDSYPSPVLGRVLADAIRARGGKPFFADTGTLYRGSRSNAVDHHETATLHGYERAVAGAPVIIADGLKGRDYREVSIEGRWFKKAKIASAFLDADAMVVLSHFKGHEMAGFGGAIKNLAMGCAPAAGKREQHSCRFFVMTERCVVCKRCLPVCPRDAIIIMEGKAHIDKAKCIGCGECSPYCATRAIQLDWDVEIVEFTQKLTEYAYAATRGKEGKLLFLSVLTDIVPDCDCAPWSDLPLVQDIGFLASTDPVALDQACFDLVTAAPALEGSAAFGKAGAGEDKFTAIHAGTRGSVQLEHGESLGLGVRGYELKEI